MCTRGHSQRHAFTLVEFVVVGAIVCLMMALLLTALLRLRETANRTICAEHLRVIGVAVAQHRAEHNDAFPTGGGETLLGGAPMPRAFLASGTPAAGVQQDWGWMYQILPYLEHEPLWSCPDDALVMRTPLAAYFCPSRRSPLVISHARKVTYLFGEQAVNDYAGNVGAFTVMEGIGLGDAACLNSVPGAAASHPIFRSGIFVKTRFLRGDASITTMDTPIQGRHVVDGLANTVLVAEKRVNASFLGRTQDGDRFGYASGFGIDTLRSGSRFPGRDEVNREVSVRDGFGSVHLDGMNTLFADGSVRFLRYDLPADPLAVPIWDPMMAHAAIPLLPSPPYAPNSVSLTLFQRLCHRADGAITNFACDLD
jgi:prepilin-type processing-associated H-X9-DG protein